MAAENCFRSIPFYQMERTPIRGSFFFVNCWLFDTSSHVLDRAHDRLFLYEIQVILAAVGRLSERKVRQDLDGLFLFLDAGLYQILDGNHSHQFPVIHQW